MALKGEYTEEKLVATENIEKAVKCEFVFI